MIQLNVHSRDLPEKTQEKSHLFIMLYNHTVNSWNYIASVTDSVGGKNIGGMILTVENRSTCRKTSPSSTLSTNSIGTGPDLKPGLHCRRPATNNISRGMVPQKLQFEHAVPRLTITDSPKHNAATFTTWPLHSVFLVFPVPIFQEPFSPKFYMHFLFL
jgi:hypothetical protein